MCQLMQELNQASELPTHTLPTLFSSVQFPEYIKMLKYYQFYWYKSIVTISCNNPHPLFTINILISF